MANPKFHVYINDTNPTPGQVVSVEVFSTEILATPPVVRISPLRFAQFISQTGPKSWRYTFKILLTDSGTLSISGITINNEFGQTVVSDIFNVKYVGQADSPFGYTPFGYGNFGTVFLFGPDTVQEEANPYNFLIRRGFEGPQIVATWSNEDELEVRVLKKLYDYPLDLLDPQAELVYQGTGTNFSDLDVLDQQVYYYSIFVQSLEDPGLFLKMGSGHILAIDNQPFNDWFKDLQPIISRTIQDQPLAPNEGDAYLIPAGALGVDWLGNDGKYAVFLNGIWNFYDPLNLWTLNVLDEGIVISYKIGQWIEVIDKHFRLNMYNLLEDYDKEIDLSSAYDILPYNSIPELDNEQVNFDMDQGKGLPTMLRFLKPFNLIHNEWLGVIAYLCELYNIRKVDLDYLLQAANLIGYEDYQTLDNPLKRFLIQQMPYIYPNVGSKNAVNLGIEMWLGLETGYIIQTHVDNVFLSNISETPVIEPIPDPYYDSPLDNIAKTVTFDLVDVYHHRGMTLWLTQPFAPSTFIEQEPVINIITTPPINPQDGDRYLVGYGAINEFENEGGSIAQYDAGSLSWVFTAPQNRWSVLDLSTGNIYVFKLIYSAWFKAIPLENLLRLDWWWRIYAQPGSVFYNFREIDDIPLVELEGLQGNPSFMLVDENIVFEFEEGQEW